MSKYSKSYWLAFFVVIFVVLAYFINESNFFMKETYDRSFKNLEDREVVKVVVGDKNLNVEIVNSAETTRKGLSDRDEIGSDGMLFIFPESSMRNFWMYNMKFDLDFVWIDGNEIVGITDNVKNPDSNNGKQNPEVVSVNKYTDKVLELNAGDVEKYGIEVGNTISLEDYGSNK